MFAASSNFNKLNWVMFMGIKYGIFASSQVTKFTIQLIEPN